MRVLVVSPNLPSPAGGANARNFYLLQAIARHHSTALVALVNPADLGLSSEIAQLADIVHSMQLIPRESSNSKRWQQLASIARGKSYLLDSFITDDVQRALDFALSGVGYDIVLFESMFMAGYHVPAGKRIIIDQHNIEYELLERTYYNEKSWLRKWYNWQESRLVKRAELTLCQRADAVLVTSERESLKLKQLAPNTLIKVVPNGVDMAMFGTGDMVEAPERIIFTGSMDYYPNIQAVLFFAQSCWPFVRTQFPGATWQIVGKNPPREVLKLAQLPGVAVTGTVPDICSYLAEAAVAIAPLFIGSGTRLKILDAFAARKAVVSTSIGCEGLLVVHGKHLLVADQPETFAHAICALLRDPQQRARLGSAGRDLVETEYSWGRSSEQLLHLLEERVAI